MQLAALVESAQHVCCRYRVRAFEPQWRQAGHSLSLHSIPRGFWQRFAIGREATHADAVILQRKLLSRIELSLLRRRVRTLIFDFDDAVFLRDSYATKGFHSSRRLRRFRKTVSRCDAVVAGNSFLAEHAERFGARVTVIPTCVDPNRYSLAQHQEMDRATLVWIGSSSTLQGLTAIAPMLEKVGAARPQVCLKVICDRFPAFQNLRTVECPWSEQTETRDLASADIGISWVPDDPWSRGKCGLKILQYMAAGLPVVANPVGVQSEMIRDGENGFLVRNESEWIDAIRMLASNPARRHAMGQAGRQLVETRYSVDAGAARWLQLLRGWEEQRIPA